MSVARGRSARIPPGIYMGVSASEDRLSDAVCTGSTRGLSVVMEEGMVCPSSTWGLPKAFCLSQPAFGRRCPGSPRGLPGGVCLSRPTSAAGRGCLLCSCSHKSLLAQSQIDRLFIDWESICHRFALRVRCPGWRHRPQGHSIYPGYGEHVYLGGNGAICQSSQLAISSSAFACAAFAPASSASSAVRLAKFYKGAGLYRGLI